MVVDSSYSRSTPFVQWVPRECSGLSLLIVKKKVQKLNLLHLSPCAFSFIVILLQK
ncbi:hypothetical protein Hanom_Chr06g00548331 [Helianthus anomalus]